MLLFGSAFEIPFPTVNKLPPRFVFPCKHSRQFQPVLVVSRNHQQAVPRSRPKLIHHLGQTLCFVIRDRFLANGQFLLKLSIGCSFLGRANNRQFLRFGRGCKDPEQRVIILCWNGVEFMIVTTGTSHGQAEKTSRDNVDPIVDDVMVIVQIASPDRQKTHGCQSRIVGFDN